jgi:predicted permease
MNLGIQLSRAAVGFAAGAWLLTVLLFGVLPAVHASHTDLSLTIKGQSAQTSGGRGTARLRSGLATAQIAFSMVLLVMAGLFARSLINVARVNLGIWVDSLLTLTVSPRTNGYSQPRTAALFDRVEEALAAVPGVTGVSSASIPLVAENDSGNSITLEGFKPAAGMNTTVRRNEVSPDFFSTLSIALIAGRNFTEADTSSAPKVAIVNQAFLRRFSLGNEAIGKHFRGFPYDNSREVDLEIVGVVADSAYSPVKQDIPPQYFQPWRQSLEPDSMTFYVRSGITPEALMRAIPGVISRIDPNLPVNNMMTMRQQVQNNVYLDRLVALLSGAFAGLATLLAAIGVYSMLAYNVALRTRELGLRLALGAQPVQLRTMVLRQVGLMAIPGSVIGLGGALALGRTAETLLFGLSGRDPWVLAAAVALALAILAAAYWPARRASNVAPLDALRYH